MRRLLIAMVLLGSVFGQALVNSPQGVIEGLNSGAVNTFLGIPYAKAERWKAPKPVEHLDGVFKATKPGPACPQRGTFTVRLGGFIPAHSEDCLNLAVWRPVAPSAKGYPVVVWIHGGSYVGGSWAEPVYEGKALAAQGVVLVGINYRLGSLGWLAAPASQGEVGSTGNFGLLDMLEALRWVQRNIQAFGGDPTNVTVMGQSAGGMATCSLLASPASRGLIHKAIIMSAGCEYVRTLEQGFKWSKEWAKQFGCDNTDLACLRKLPLSVLFPPEDRSIGALMERTNSGDFTEAPWKPHVDGVVLHKVPLQALRDGSAAGIPLIVGATSQEAWGDRPGAPADWPSFAVRAARVDKRLAGRGSEATTIYQARHANPADAWAYFQSDRILVCPTYAASAAQSAYAPTWHYMVDWASPVLLDLGSFHGIDMPLLFGTQRSWPSLIASVTREAMQSARGVTETFQRYWLEFAKRGDPGMDWLDASSGKALLLGERTGLIADPYLARCTLFGAEAPKWYDRYQ
jgi:para-nitrobenzyl esterase